VEDKIPGHSVEENKGQYRAVPAMMLLDVLALTLPHCFMSSINLPWYVEIE